MAELVPGKTSILGLQMAAFSLCPHIVFLCALLVSLPLPVGLGLHPY